MTPAHRIFATLALAATGLTAREPGPAGALFRYTPNEGRSSDHAKAYRQHLEWHRSAGDPLDWYAWRVDSGPGRGDFVDGTFDLAWADFDARPRPAEDAADFAATAGPLARAVDTRYLERLSRASRWNGKLTTPHLLIYEVVLRPGCETEFERFLAQGAPTDPTPRIWFRLTSGGPGPQYLLLLPTRTLVQLPEGPAYWVALGRRPGARLRTWVLSLRSESWRFLPELSLIPARDGGDPR